jgi:multimeric flavodoxin WrbA
MPEVQLGEAEFRRRFRSQFVDPAFDPLDAELDRLAGAAWAAYSESRKWPRTEKAGFGFADPDYDLGVEWMAAHRAIRAAQAEHDDPAAPHRVLIVNGSSRSEHTCPGEMSKSWRLTQIAAEACRAGGMQVELLNLSRLAAEYGRRIHPCKACFSTAAALCHWPCSCYPNHALGQTQDMMNDIYPLWVRAHGIMLVTPVNWYHTSSPMKLMIDRMVCADGGNPDPTTTDVKDVVKAKQLELDGWPYPRHLAGRLFAIVVHGDVEGAENVRRSLADWLRFMHLEPAGNPAQLDRYIGYWEPYATSHEALDQDAAIQEEVRNAARTLVEAVKAKREGRWTSAGERLESPRQK